MSVPNIRLNSDSMMPKIGFGTWHLNDGRESMDSVSEALRIGYRLIDTAKLYGNENSVGKAVINSGISREEIFITTKLWTSDLGFDTAKRAFETSLDRLGVDYLDLYLIHWPGYDSRLRKQAWTALSDLYEEGILKAAGVSNYEVDHIEEILNDSSLLPAVNQIELHPFNYAEQKPLIEYCKQKGIVVEAYSPLARGRRVDHPSIARIANKYQRTNAQIMLRWAIQHETVPIPKSKTPARIKQNFEVFDFELTRNDMRDLDSLSIG